MALPQITGWREYAQIRAVLVQALADVADARSGAVIVDLTDTILVDTSGLVLLTWLHARAALSGCPLRLVVPTESVPIRHALRATGLASLMQVFPCLDAATSAPADGHRPGSPAATQRVLDRIHAMRRSGVGPQACQVVRQDRTRLAVTLRAEADHVRITLDGVLDRVTTKRVGEMLTSLADLGMHHLVLEITEEPAALGDFLAVLLGVRWRVAAQGGCLTMPAMPSWLRYSLHRNGLEGIFDPCGPAHAVSGG